MTINDGGPAYPVTAVEGSNSGYPGMTLRQHYASEQTAAWIVALSRRYGENGYADSQCFEEAVRLGFNTADAMLAREERERSIEAPTEASA